MASLCSTRRSGSLICTTSGCASSPHTNHGQSPPPSLRHSHHNLQQTPDLYRLYRPYCVIRGLILVKKRVLNTTGDLLQYAMSSNNHTHQLLAAAWCCDGGVRCGGVNPLKLTFLLTYYRKLRGKKRFPQDPHVVSKYGPRFQKYMSGAHLHTFPKSLFCFAFRHRTLNRF